MESTDNISIHPETSSEWMVQFHRKLQRGRSIVLHGNISDQFMLNGNYVLLEGFMRNYFRQRGYQLIVNYDPVGAFTVTDEAEMTYLFEQIVMGSAAQLPVATTTAPHSPFPPTESTRVSPLEQARRSGGRLGAELARRLPTLAPDQAFTAFHSLLSQKEVPTALMFHYVDRLCSDARRFDREELAQMIRLDRVIRDVATISKGPLAFQRNAFIMIAQDLNAVPAWLYRESPFVEEIKVAKPGAALRKTFTDMRLNAKESFHGNDAIPPANKQRIIDDFADLTDGMSLWDLESIRRASKFEQISIADPRKLVDHFKYGEQENPWQKLDHNKICNAEDALKKRVIGQDSAIKAISNVLIRAKGGLSLDQHRRIGGRPKGVFFFVGPSGVGKTELAKALSEHVFGDESAFVRFDMSEYQAEHAAQKLIGAPAGYIGYGDGGLLTNRIIEKPYSVLLFDEIEKAHPRVMDSFLQILEDGRLTDNKGKTAYFSESIIIFTSNIGSGKVLKEHFADGAEVNDESHDRTNLVLELLKKVADIELADKSNVNKELTDESPSYKELTDESPSYKEVSDTFHNEVKMHFNHKLNRPELLNRFGNQILVFDLLRPAHIEPIARKFLQVLENNAMELCKLALDFNDPSIMDWIKMTMKPPSKMLKGGREVRTTVDDGLVTPLNQWIFDNSPKAGRYKITIDLATGLMRPPQSLNA